MDFQFKFQLRTVGTYECIEHRKGRGSEICLFLYIHIYICIWHDGTYTYILAQAIANCDFYGFQWIDALLCAWHIEYISWITTLVFLAFTHHNFAWKLGVWCISADTYANSVHPIQFGSRIFRTTIYTFYNEYGLLKHLVYAW